jgi:hypothetical protein
VSTSYRPATVSSGKDALLIAHRAKPLLSVENDFPDVTSGVNAIAQARARRANVWRPRGC